MKKLISVEKFAIALFLASAVLGYVISIGKLYLFHLVAVMIVGLMFSGYLRVYAQTFLATKALLLFFAYAVLTLLWAPNFKNGIYVLFYFANAFFIIFILINFSQTKEKLNFIFKVLSIFFLLNFFIGLLETTGYFRLPMSPYYGLSFTKPSGFNSNLNNFGFVFLAIFPFLFLYPQRLAKFISTILAVWFAFKLESKGFFLGLIAFFVFYFFWEIKKKSTWRWIALLGFMAFIMLLFSIVLMKDIQLNNSVFSTFSQIERGVDLMRSEEIEARDSTGVRSFMYIYGLQELASSYGRGTGAAGVGSKLAIDTELFGEDKDLFSFHNFFLEMLIDYGVLPFAIIMFGYFRLINKLKKYSAKANDTLLGYYAKASALSLLTILPASISPSSIIYVFAFWLVIGFSIATSNLITKNNSMFLEDAK